MTVNDRIVKVARLAMSTWARKWAFIRNDDRETERAAWLLAQAIHMRDKANLWKQKLNRKHQ